MPHNGGRSQINLAFGGHFAYLNLLRSAQTWALGDWSGHPTADLLDINGYPITHSALGVVTSIALPSPASRPGNYVCRWRGEGEISGNFDASVISGRRAGANGRFVFSVVKIPVNAFNQISVILKIARVDPANRITSLELFHEDDEPRLDQGEVFGVRFLQKLREANFGVLRFIDWQHTNQSMIARWSDVPGPGHYSVSGLLHDSRTYAGVTSTRGNAYAATLAGFVLADKAAISVKWNADATGPATLNVSGTGDVPIRTQEMAPVSGATLPKAGRPAYLVYDAVLNCWMKRGGDSSGKEPGVWSTPIETMVMLANELGAHPWFCIPHLALDPPSDFTMRLATFVRDHLASGLVPRFEPSNEVWNTYPGFAQTQFAIARANARWGATGMDACHNWYGMVLSQMGEVVKTAYEGDTSRYHVVGGIQTVAAEALDARFDSSRWVAQKQQGVNKPARETTSHLAITNYWNSAFSAQEELDAAFEYAAASEERKRAIAGEYVTRDQHVFKGYGVINQFRLRQVAKLRAAFAKERGLVLTFYEGGWSPDYPMSGSNPINYDARLAQITRASRAVVTLFNNSWPTPPVGASVVFHDVAGMTELNGKTSRVVDRNVPTSQFTIDVDTTAFGAFVAPQSDIRNANYTDSGRFRTNLRAASKAHGELAGLTARLYQEMAEFGVHPSHFMFGGGGNAWSLWDPNIYATASPQWVGIVGWNPRRAGAQR